MKGENKSISMLDKVVKLKKEILIGFTDEDEAVTLQIDTICGYNIDENKSFSISGDIYDMKKDNLMTEEQGEERARKYLEDDVEMWKQAVANDSTTASFEDWCEHVINIDGWEQVLGEVEGIGDYNGEYYYINGSSSGGQIDLPDFDRFVDIKVTEDEYNSIAKAWKELHLKSYSKLNDTEVKLINKVVCIFSDHDSFNVSDLEEYLPIVLGQED